MDEDRSPEVILKRLYRRGQIDAWLYPTVLFFVTVISRIPFTSRLLYDQDAVQFALALEDYDIYLHQPHPPGYFLYVMAGKLLNLFFQDANSSFLTLSVIASGFTVVAIYHLAKVLFDREAGLWAAIFAVTSPLLWYYGELALTYVVAACFNTWIAILCWDLLQKESRWLHMSGVALGITGGIRQDVLIFLFPLWLFCIVRLHWKQFMTALLILGGTVAAWFVPMVLMTGGMERYSAAIREYWSFHTSTFAVWNAGIGSRGYFLVAFFGNISYGIGIGTIVLLFALYALIRVGRWRLISTKRIFFFGLWLGPAFVFHILVFMNPDQAGYSVFFLPALLVLLWPSFKFALTEIGRVTDRPSIAAVVTCRRLVLILSAVNAIFFLLSDSVVSAKGIREHDRDLAQILTGIERNFPPIETLIIDDKFYGLYNYRHVQYYCRQYRVYLTALSKEGLIILGKDGQTFIVKSVHIPADVRYLVYLVNPRDHSYVETLALKGLRRLPLDERNALLYDERG